MFHLAILLAVSLPSATDPETGPLDAFRANYASIKVDLQYRYTTGVSDPAIVKRMWRLKDAEYDAEPDYGMELPAKPGFIKYVTEGRWSCDGRVQHFDFATPEWLLKKIEERKTRSMSRHVLETELLYGESVLVGHHYLNQQSTNPYIHLDWNDNTAVLGFGTSPFLWFATPFPQSLEGVLRGVAPHRRDALRDGHPVEVELYEHDYEHDPAAPDSLLYRLEVSYDPAVGYLPRFARSVSTSKDGVALVSEMYLIEARRCSASGFVPTEWYDTQFEVSDFAKRYPKYDDDTHLEPSDRIPLGHFKVLEFKDRATPVALTRLEGVKGLISYHQVVAKFPPTTRSLTMAQIRALAGKYLTNPPISALPELGSPGKHGPGGLAVDTEELNAFPDQPTRKGPRYLYLGIVVVVLCAAFVLRRRVSGRVLSLVALCCWTLGCARQPQPLAAKLSAGFVPSHVLYDVTSRFPALKLVVRNEGAQPLRLRGADGGCWCRKIDQSKFPILLKPSQEASLDVEIAAGAQPTLQGFAITFDTDGGKIGSQVSFLTLPTHQFNPGGLIATLQEGREADWHLEMVHRAVFRSDEPRPATTLEFPPELLVNKTGSHTEPVNQAPELQFEDSTYQILFRDPRLGLGKAFIKLRGPDGRILGEVPVTWRRVPFLSSAPDRVILGSHPVRVFLTCPEERVELTSVISKPAGIKAVVNSPRELTVMLDEGAAEVIDGAIEVGTTAPGRPPLGIRVVRYAPSRRVASTP